MTIAVAELPLFAGVMEDVDKVMKTNMSQHLWGHTEGMDMSQELAIDLVHYINRVIAVTYGGAPYDLVEGTEDQGTLALRWYHELIRLASDKGLIVDPREIEDKHSQRVKEGWAM